MIDGLTTQRVAGALRRSGLPSWRSGEAGWTCWRGDAGAVKVTYQNHSGLVHGPPSFEAIREQQLDLYQAVLRVSGLHCGRGHSGWYLVCRLESEVRPMNGLARTVGGETLRWKAGEVR